MNSVSNKRPDGPLVEKYHLKLSPPTIEDNQADMERVLLALSAHVTGEIEVTLPVAAVIPAALRESGFDVTAAVALLDKPRLVALEPGDTRGRNLGLAVDLGTTNVAARLVNLADGETLGEAVAENPQVAFGEDVLTRIHHCLNEGGIEELQRGAASCIGGLAARLSEDAKARADDIHCVTVAGNTTMAHLLLGLDPYNIPRAPYVPVAGEFGSLRAGELGIGVNPEAAVYVLPNVGSYVGGDVLAGILVSGMHKDEGVSILVDVGTNAEIVVGCRDWLLVSAGAAGPALEGGVARFGMRAMPGAIERVGIDPETLEPEYSVIGGEGERPKGLCGSALIDLLAGLFTAGLIDERGRFRSPAKTGRVVESLGGRAYVVVPASEADADGDIVFTETDIDNLIRTKAAMFTALSVVTSGLGLTFEDIVSFHVAGTFGAYIDAGKAVTIGMLPDIGINRYRALGNSSIEGAARVMASRSVLSELKGIAGIVTYKEMNVSTDFMSEFRAAMFLPHTDRSLFPSNPKEL